ncbi:MAG: carboxyl transferase domain-containing protein [Aeromicrobium sp.]
MVHAVALLDAVLDPGSYTSWDTNIDTSGLPDDYRRVLAAAAATSGVDEAVLTGSGRVDGRPVATMVGEFGFLAGSIGQAAGDRIVSAIRRATAERLPLLASTSSGGTRMQEGTPAFVKMADIARALTEHKAAGLPYLVHLRHPTTGGVLASWGSLGHITVAEPGALVGFLGPRVFEAMRGSAFPEGVQVSERLAEHGVLDGIVATEDLRDHTASALALLLDPPAGSTRERRPGVETREGSDASVWENIEATRSAGRPGLRELLAAGSDATVHLAGTGEGERNDAVTVALARLDGAACVVIGHDRVAEAQVPLGPAGLRGARRGMRLAEDLRLPLVTVVDTAGADLSEEAELGALAGEIARTLAQLTTLRTPTVSVLLGQGTGGGALALLPAQTVIATEKSWLSPLPPEGASAILFGSTERAADMARDQRVGALDMLADGIVHHVVPELADDDVSSLCNAIAAEVGARLRDALQ